MVKFTAILVMTAMLCSLTACGKDTADEVTDESSVTSIAEVSEETTEETTEEVTETDEVSEEETESSETEPETENKPSETVSTNGTYEEAIEMYIDCINNRDVESMMKLTFPDKYVDVMKIFAEMSGNSLEDITDEFQEYGGNTRLVEIVSAEPMSSEDLEMLTEMYGSFEVIRQYVEQNGKDNIDEEKLEEFIYELDMEELPKPYFEAADGQIVKFIIESEDENGDKETSEVEFMMYYIDGEGWKNDMSMMGYVKKSKQASMNAAASSLMKASNATLCDLDEMGVEFPEKCIICSDSTKNYNVNEDFLSDVEENLKYYFSDYKEFDYIIVIDDGICPYTACTTPENSKFIGTYPANKLYSADGDPVTMDGKYTLDEIYQLCIDEIQK